MVTQGPHVLFEGNRPISADVVFVHGLRGDAYKTWSSDKICWPRDLLPLNLENARVITWGYDSAFARPSDMSSQLSIFGHSENLLDDISGKRWNSEEKTRPIVFVGHSLGGLLIKQALIRSSQYLNSRQDPELGAIYSCTAGVVFLGTPHRGSEKSGLALAEVFARIAKAALHQPNNKLLTNLKHGSEILEQQRRAFASISEKMPLVCFYEEKPVPVLGLIVPEDSACIDGFHVKTVSIPANHMDMCKFAEDSDTGYMRVSRHIISLVRKAEENMVSVRRIIQDESLLKDQQDRDCLHALFVTNPLDDMARIQDTKDSLLEGTCSWILTDSNYEKWYHDQLSRVLWVHGDPGKGKTMLAISQITRLRNRIDNSAATLSYFFCDNKDNRRNNAVHVLRGLLYQLLCQRPDSIMFLRDEYEKQKSQLFSSPTALQCLWRVLESVLRQSTDGIAWLVIDALDECEPESRGILLSRIKSRVSGQRGVTRESSNNQEKWFLTSRNEPLIKDSMTGSLDISLESNSVNVEADVEEFINAQVQELQETKKYREDFMMSIKQILSEKAGGTFLWVSLACAELKKAPGIQAKKVLKRLPSGLNAFYEQLLHRTLDNEDEELAGYARDILVAVLAAFRPLSLSELAVMAGLPQEHWADEGSIREYAEQCGSFLTIRQQDVHFVHQSAKDYLSSLKTFVSSPNLAEEHKTLTSRCLNYFCSGVFDAGPINLHSDDSLSANDSTSDIEDETSCDSISIIEESRGEAARYPIMLWMAHGQAASSDLWDSLNQAQAFFSPTSVVRDAWFTTYWDFHYGFPAPGDCSLLHIAVHSDIEALLAKILPWTKHTINWTDHDGQTPLAWASSIGIEAVMKLLLGVEGVEIDSKNDVGRTPLSLAAIKEYDRYVKLLLEHGALPNTEDTSSRTPLSYAAEYGSESCVELLLDSGALPNTENTQGRTPLSYAAECGNESCLKLLLESGALPNTENTRGRTPLSYAAECGNESCLKLLLESGALPNTEDTFSRTPLSYAAGDGDESCLKLLLESGALPNTEDTRGQTPLSYAARCGSESCLKLLLESGALPDIESTLGGLPLLYAAYRGNESCLKLLLESGALPDIQNNLGETLLALAARCGNLSCVELLLDSGAKPDFEDDKGQTPLSYATEGLASTPEHSRQRYEAVVKLLLKSGAKADSKDDNGCTPLAFAAGCGNLSCVELLLDSGAKPDFEDNDGQTPLSYATGGLVHGPEHSRKSYQTIVMLLSASVAELDSGRSSTESMNMAEATGQRSQQSNKRPRIS